MMKKVFGLVLAMVLLVGVALAEESIYNPSAGTMDAPNIFKAMEQNKFAFKKNFADKRILVCGVIDRVDEGKFELMDTNSPKMPEITLKGLFHAFLAEKMEDLDLAELNPNDVFFGICTGFAEGMGGMSVKAKCQPVLVTRRQQDGQFYWVWVTPDKEALDFSFTPQMVERLTKK